MDDGQREAEIYESARLAACRHERLLASGKCATCFALPGCKHEWKHYGFGWLICARPRCAFRQYDPSSPLHRSDDPRPERELDAERESLLAQLEAASGLWETHEPTRAHDLWVAATQAWRDALREAEKREREPLAAAERARVIALARVRGDAMKAAVRVHAQLEIDRATAVQELRSKVDRLLRELPNREQWAQFYEREIAPASRWLHPVERCGECGKPFVRTKTRRFCSDTCSARRRMRGRGTQSARRDAAADALKKHAAGCRLCKQGKECPRVSIILASAPSTDALAHRGDVTPEDADEMLALEGRARRRRSP